MPIDIQDEVWFFLESEDFDCEGVREESTILRRRIRMGEIIVNHLFSEEGTASIGMKFTLDLMSDSWDRCACALHPIDKVFGSFPILYRFIEVPSGSIDRPTESRADREESGYEG